MTVIDLYAQHERSFEANRFVYPVLSRRSGGLSIGVNLNPDKVCNFDCIYCQVDRREESETRFVEIDNMLAELRAMLELCSSGEIFQTAKFRDTPDELRKVCDIAFSGDGEPTTYKNFDELMAASAELKQEFDAKHPDADPIKMVLITNASMFHREHVQRGIAVLDDNQGEVWAKLDAGTEAYYQQVERTKIPFQQVLDNITAAARLRPLVIQAMFLRIDDVGPTDEEQRAFCDRLSEITAAGGKLSLVQIYTVARQPAESCVSALSDREVDTLVELVKKETGLACQGYYGK